MSVVSGLIVLVGSSLLLWLALLGLALVRKLRRDRRESRSIERRAHYESVLGTADVDAIAAVFTAARDTEAQMDLGARAVPFRSGWWVRANAARALRELGDPGIEALRRAVEHEDRFAADRAREQLALHTVIAERVAA